MDFRSHYYLILTTLQPKPIKHGEKEVCTEKHSWEYFGLRFLSMSMALFKKYGGTLSLLGTHNKC
tara:strand:- start:742 stop:936 length:195 start_codon:yes stop_codon:yes gene_type:complete